MDLLQLKALVRQGEGARLEFKLKATHPEKIVREIVAFANTDGGTLLVGVGDDKSIPGLKFADEDEYLLVRGMEQLCRPAIAYRLARVPIVDEREVLVVNIPKSPLAPHLVIQEPDHHLGKVYVRVDDRSVQASKELREIMKGVAKQRNVRFQFGEKERVLMQYLAQYPRITVDEFSRTANIPRHIASRTLVLLVLANVIRVQPQEVHDFFAVA